MTAEKVLAHHAERVLFFSSQYGSENSRSYNVCNLVGRPSRYPSYGDFTEAAVLRTYGPWWKMAPSASKKIGHSVCDFLSIDFVDLCFPKTVLPTKVDIYETYNPGTVVRILAWVYDPSVERNGENINYRWEILWKSKPVQVKHQARIFSPEIKQCQFPTRLIRLEFNSKYCNYYTELDSVCLHGKECSITDKEPLAVKPLHEAFGKLSLNFNEKKVESIERHISLTSQPSQDEKESAGYFNILPTKWVLKINTSSCEENRKNELVTIVLSYLTLEELVTMCSTCRYFHVMCYDPMWYREINLQPYWHKITDRCLDNLISRCQKLERINLSWVGHCRLGGGYLVRPETLARFLRECCQHLTSLQLACCDIVTQQLISELPTYCSELSELSLSSCSFATESLVALARLKNLKRLNLYRIQVRDNILKQIIQGCKRLEHFNNGSNCSIQDGNEVLKSLGANCWNLISLDLWRWKTITASGVMELVENCANLEELDFGWCANMKSDEDCIKKIARCCRKLRKIFLTAVRSINNYDVVAIADHCPQLQQFDILGTSKVSPFSIDRLLQNCKDLKLLDLSFCPQIQQDHVKVWRESYPYVDIKKSFTDTSD